MLLLICVEVNIRETLVHLFGHPFTSAIHWMVLSVFVAPQALEVTCAGFGYFSRSLQTITCSLEACSSSCHFEIFSYLSGVVSIWDAISVFPLSLLPAGLLSLLPRHMQTHTFYLVLPHCACMLQVFIVLSHHSWSLDLLSTFSYLP